MRLFKCFQKDIIYRLILKIIASIYIYLFNSIYYLTKINFQTSDPNSKAILEEFLLYLINYFYWYFELIDSQVFDNAMCM